MINYGKADTVPIYKKINKFFINYCFLMINFDFIVVFLIGYRSEVFNKSTDIDRFSKGAMFWGVMFSVIEGDCLL
jgi:hypothetical protein